MRSLRFCLFLFLICLVFAGSASADLDSLIGNFGDSADKKTKPNQDKRKSSDTTSNGLSDIMSDMSAKVIQKEEEKRKKEEEAAINEYLDEVRIQTRRYLVSIAGPKPIVPMPIFLTKRFNYPTQEERDEQDRRIKYCDKLAAEESAAKKKDFAAWQRKLPATSVVKKHVITLRPHDQMFQKAVEEFFADENPSYYSLCDDSYGEWKE